MDPRRLLIFRTVVRNGSIGAGARELGWTQPAVSQHLAALEKEVGTQLLLRSSAGITPTEAGRRLASHAEAIAAQLDAAEQELADITALRRGSVRFGTFPSAAAVLLPPVLATLSSTAPDLDVTFRELEPPEAVDAVREGELDVALVFRYPCSDLTDEGTLEWSPLLEDRVMLVLPQDHPRADDPELTLADLAAEPWIAGCKRCRANLISSARRAGFVPTVRHSTDDSIVVQRLIQHGGGVALMPETSLEAAPNDQVRVRPLAGLDNRMIGLINRRGAQSIPAVAALRDALVEQTRERLDTAALI
ncbi:LysR family transcriptional regulator [Brachybacterium sp. J153]|uniref:LysR family transcriptional regulator n=1 Tax=Brachybacterium sp. J153 TaxID=3116488 RepID=UPI002E780F05|nr:LysR family transcriptional regulator [Brachybacterium sp. J153]MEE1619688.1 LysR family transcriptional regulator [Brachybacterium sp. J153]